MSDKLTNPTVKLSNIILPEVWNREKLGDIRGLVASIKEDGLEVPISVRASDKPGKFIVVDGRRRLAAFQELKKTEIPVTYSNAKKDDDAFFKSLITNLAREDNTPAEIAIGFGKLVTDYKYTNERIAKACGKTAGYVSQHLAVLKASKKLQNGLRKGTVSLSIFRHFAKLDLKKDEVIYAKLTELALNGVSAQDVGDKIDIYIKKAHDKIAADAAKAGKKAPATKSKRGAAAHKPKKAPGPKVKVRDYNDPEVQKIIKPVGKTLLIKRATQYGEDLQTATTSNKKAYLQGLIDGLEEALGMVDYE